MASDQGKSKLFGEGLPGTGGDFVDPKDVEGHVRLTESEPLGAPKPESLGAPNAPGPTDGRSDDDDVVGHTSGGPDQGHGWGEDAPGRSSVRFIDEDDVEGHHYRNGPTTQGGEFAKRVPSDNPRGER